MGKQTVHIVLLVSGGIPDDPEVFESEVDAMERYTDLCADVLRIEGAHKMTEHELFEAVRQRSDDSAADDDLFLYETEVM